MPGFRIIVNRTNTYNPPVCFAEVLVNVPVFLQNIALQITCGDFSLLKPLHHRFIPVCIKHAFRYRIRLHHNFFADFGKRYGRFIVLRKVFVAEGINAAGEQSEFYNFKQVNQLFRAVAIKNHFVVSLVKVYDAPDSMNHGAGRPHERVKCLGCFVKLLVNRFEKMRFVLARLVGTGIRLRMKEAGKEQQG